MVQVKHHSGMQGLVKLMGLGLVILVLLVPSKAEPSIVGVRPGPGINNADDNYSSQEGKDGLNDDDVASLLINTLHSGGATPVQPGSHGIPEIEMMKLKAATKGAGLSDAKAERVLRAVRALDLKYHEVVDLKKVMMNPATSANYAERVRRALEDAVVDAHMKNSEDDTSDHSPRNSNYHGQTLASMADSDLRNPFSRRGVDATGNALPVGGLSSRPTVNGPQLFFGTPLTEQALPEDLENLWILASHVLPRKDAFELVQNAYFLKLTRSQVFDLQTEFSSGKMTLASGSQLLAQLKAKVAMGGMPVPPVAGGPVPVASPPDLSKPLDTATLKRLHTVAQLSGLDKENSTRLVRAVQNSGLHQEQVDLLGEQIQSSAASPHDIGKLVDHLEETSYRKRDIGGEDFVATPEQAKGADWIFEGGDEIHDQHEKQLHY